MCLAVAFASPLASATIYYVDATSGVDSNAGTSPATAWRTLTKVNGTAYFAGDRIRFKRGEAWRGRLAILRQGTEANPIVFEPYGEGAAPILNSSQLVTNWTPTPGNRYTAPVSSRVEQVFVDDVRGLRRESLDELSQPGDWHWLGGVLTLHSEVPPAKAEAAVDLFALWFIGSAHVHADGFHVKRSLHSVWLLNSSHITLENLTVEDGVGYAGIVITSELANRGRNNVIRNCDVFGTLGSSASLSVAGNGSGIYVIGNAHCGENLIEGNRIHDNGHEGIQLSATDANIVRGNTVYNHAESGIRAGFPACKGNIIEYNTVYANAQRVDDRFGIDMIYVGDDNVVRYNTVFGQQSIPGGQFKSGGIRFDGNDGSGTVLTESSGNTAYYNVVYDEFTGINVFSFSNVHVYNNTVVGSKDFGIAVNAPVGVTPKNTVVKNNLVAPASGTVFAHVNLSNSQVNNNFYYVPPGSFFGWNTFLLSYSTYRALSQLDANSLTGNPLLLDLAALDFQLLENSPVIDAGVEVGLTRDFVGSPVPWNAAPDIGAFEYYIAPPPEGEGAAEGEIEGTPEGIMEGALEGALEGEGTIEGSTEGSIEGAVEGAVEGSLEGVVEGVVEGGVEGAAEGASEGSTEGSLEGTSEGDFEGSTEGILEGEGAAEEERCWKVRPRRGRRSKAKRLKENLRKAKEEVTRENNRKVKRRAPKRERAVMVKENPRSTSLPAQARELRPCRYRSPEQARLKTRLTLPFGLGILATAVPVTVLRIPTFTTRPVSIPSRSPSTLPRAPIPW